MADSKPYRVTSKKNNKDCNLIILVDGSKVFTVKGNGKDKEIPGAYHSCLKPEKPAKDDSLTLAGFGAQCKHDLSTKALYRDASSGGTPGFYYVDPRLSKSEGSKGGIGDGDWEAVDAGGGLKEPR